MNVISLGPCYGGTSIQYVITDGYNAVVASCRQDIKTRLIYDINFCTTLPSAIEQIMEVIKNEF